MGKEGFFFVFNFRNKLGIGIKSLKRFDKMLSLKLLFQTLNSDPSILDVALGATEFLGRG